MLTNGSNIALRRRILKTVVFVFLLSFSYGVSVTRLHAQSWDQQISGTYAHFSGVAFIDTLTGWVCGSAGKILKTTNGGATWFAQGLTPGVDLSDITFVDANTGWAAGLGGVILKTADGGMSWNLQSVGTTGWLYSIRFSDSQNGWAGGLYGTILRTTNGGTTWTAQTSGTASTINKVCVYSSTVVSMVTSDGGVLKTTNGGTTWTLQTLSPPSSLTSMCFQNGSVGYLAGAGGRISKTTDGGATWTDQVSGTVAQLNSISFIRPDTGWAVGDGGIIRATTNGGVTWTTQISGTLENLRSVYFVDPTHGYSVGLNNTILQFALTHALPVQLASFTAAVVNNNAVRLSWRTISEVNNYGFEVERSIGSASGFVLLSGSFVAGHGTTNTPQNYAYVDNNVPAGRLYYRLRQTDLDGTVHYSDPVSVDGLTGVPVESRPTEFSLKQNYPNPFNPSTNIEFSLANGTYVSLKVFDVLGREVATLVNEQMNQGKYVKMFNANGLASGVYWYKLTAGNFTQTRKFVLSK